MRIFLVSIYTKNGRYDYSPRASRASVAVQHAMDRVRSHALLDDATITVKKGAAIKYEYVAIADVPCEPAGSFKREDIGVVLRTEDLARQAVRDIRASRPQYKYVSYRRIEVTNEK
jgi:hypothetical protein